MNKGVLRDAHRLAVLTGVAILVLLNSGCASTSQSATQFHGRRHFSSSPPKGWLLTHETTNATLWSSRDKPEEIVSFFAHDAKGAGDPMKWDIRKAGGHDVKVENDTRSLLCGRIKARYVVLENTSKHKIMETVFSRVGDLYYDAAYIRPSGTPADASARSAIMSMCPKDA